MNKKLLILNNFFNIITIYNVTSDQVNASIHLTDPKPLSGTVLADIFP